VLSELRVIDYAIIDNIHLTFVPGLNILTGETGAGKSIVVGALSFVLGERVTDDIVRKGSDVCRVEAVFNLDKDGLNHRLGESTVADRGGQLTVSRELRRGGRSKCMVNGEALSWYSSGGFSRSA
jgi:DNA repair protein RecN (Recombination protein N)